MPDSIPPSPVPMPINRKTARLERKEREAATALSEASQAKETAEQEAKRQIVMAVTDRNVVWTALLLRFGAPLVIPVTDLQQAEQLVSRLRMGRGPVPLAATVGPLRRLWLRLTGKTYTAGTTLALVLRWARPDELEPPPPAQVG